MQVFALTETRPLAEKVAGALGIQLGSLEERDFEDGEHKARPLESVRGGNVFVVQTLDGGPTLSPNDKLVRLLFLTAALKDNGAREVTAVIPYLAYARKDRQTKTRDPVNSRYVAELIEAAGVECVVCFENHNVVAFQNAFRRRTVHLDSRPLFVERAIALAGSAPAVVASPDPGGVKRAQLFREMLERRLGRPVGAAFLDKRRSAGKVSGDVLAGDVAGASVFLVDDLVSTGGTLARAARKCREEGASSVYAFAAHGLLVGDAGATLRASMIEKLVISDSVTPWRVDPDILKERVEIVSVAPLLAGAIRVLSGVGSISSLTGDED